MGLEKWDRAGPPLSKLYEPISNRREKLAPLGWRIENLSKPRHAEPGDQRSFTPMLANRCPGAA
jgi:hypothetical protein